MNLLKATYIPLTDHKQNALSGILANFPNDNDPVIGNEVENVQIHFGHI
jgi:hypothetical protein